MRNSSSLDWLRFMHTPNDYRVSLFLAAVAVTFSFAMMSCAGNKTTNAASEGEETTVETVEAVVETDSCCQAKDSCATACDKKADCAEKKECCDKK